VLWIALAIAASIAAGVEAERRAGARAGEWARGILKFLLYVVMPLVAFFNIARLEVDADVGVGIPLAWLALLITALVGWLIGRKVLHLEPPSAGVLAIVGLQANTGLLGVAVVAAVLGFDHVSQGVAYDALVQQPVFFIGSFAIAAATGTKAGETVPERVRAFFVRKIREADRRARVDDGMLGDEALELRFHRIGQRIVRRTQIGELRLPAARRNCPRGQQRILRR